MLHNPYETEKIAAYRQTELEKLIRRKAAARAALGTTNKKRFSAPRHQLLLQVLQMLKHK